MSFDVPKSENVIISTTPVTNQPATVVAPTKKTNSVFTTTTGTTAATAATATSAQTTGTKEQDIKIVEKNKIIEELKKRAKEGKVTEGDIYKELKRLEHENLLSKEQKELLKHYEELKEQDKTDPGYSEKIFAQNAKISELPKEVKSVGVKKDIKSDTTTSTTEESTTPESQTPKTEKTQDETEIENYFTKHRDQIPEDATIDDIYAFLINKDERTEEEQKILDILNNNKKGLTQNTDNAEKNSPDISPEKAKQLEKCNEIIQGTGTNYEKLSQIMDMYLSENDPEYQKLPDYQGTSYKKDKKRQYRDNLIAELRKDFAPGNLSTSERAIMHQKLTALFTSCIAQDKTIESITSQGKGAIKQEINNLSNKSFDTLLKNIKIDENSKADDIIISFADQLFANKPEYKNLKTQEEKLQYIKTKTGEIFEKTLGITIGNLKLTPERETLLKEAAAMAIKELKNKGYSLSDLENEGVQATFLSDVMIKNSKLMEKIKNEFPEMYHGIKTFIVKNVLIANLKENDKDGVITEGEIFEELKRLEKNGYLNGEDEDNKIMREMLKYYECIKDMDKTNPKYAKALFSQKASNSSLIAKAALVGKDVPTYIHEMLLGKEGDDLKTTLKKMAIDANGDLDGATFSAVLTELTKIYGSPTEALQAMRDAGFRRFSDVEIREISRGNGKIAAEIGNFIDNYGTKEEKEECLVVAELSGKYLDVTQTGIFLEHSNKFYEHSIAQSINNYKSEHEAVQIHSYIANSQIVTDERKSSITQSLVETAEPTRQVYYAREMSKIKNSAVTEGLAAAEQKVDSSVKQQYSKYVDNAIKNNGYSAEQKANIEQARQTGQTSYARSESAQTSSGTTSPRRAQSSSGNTQAQTSAGTTTPPRTSSSSSRSSSTTSSASSPKVTSSPSSSSSSATSTNYGDQVTKALTDKKERVQERITQIIDNYQKSVKSQEVKTESSKETTAQAAKAAEKEAKIVKDFVESSESSSNIDAKTIKELKSAYSSSGMSGLYQKLGSISEGLQERFLSYFARYSDSNTLHSFASNFSNNKSLILSLYQYSNDPSLLAYLGESATRDLLSKGKIKLKDFLKYASPSTIALYISDLSKTGNNELLKQIFGMLNLSQTSYVEQHATTSSAKGGDNWLEQLQNNMSRASGFDMSDGLAMGSDRAPMGRSYDKMKQRGPFYFNA